MSIRADFSLSRYEDGTLLVSMDPPEAIGGWDIRWDANFRFGGESGLMLKSTNSGFNGVSGITITNSGIGKFSITVDVADTSGLQYGAYVHKAEKHTSGRASIVHGYFRVTP